MQIAQAPEGDILPGFVIPGLEARVVCHTDEFPVDGMLALGVSVIGRERGASIFEVPPGGSVRYWLCLQSAGLALGLPTFSIDLTDKADVLALCRSGAKLIEVYMLARTSPELVTSALLEASTACRGGRWAFDFMPRIFDPADFGRAPEDCSPRQLQCAQLRVLPVVCGAVQEHFGSFAFYRGLEDALALASQLQRLERIISGGSDGRVVRAPVFRGPALLPS